MIKYPEGEEVRGMRLMVTMVNPLHKVEDGIKTFLKMAETTKPQYTKSLGLYACHGDVGYKLYNIVEIDDDHISEGLTELYRNLMLYDNIEGFKVKVELLYSMRTGVELLKEAGRI